MINIREKIRVRIMQEALDLADRNDSEGYNSVKVMCTDVLGLMETPQRQPEQELPPEWPLIKNILAEYGLGAISFVAEFKAAQRPWVGLTDGDWEKVANRKNTVLDTFEQGAVWAAYKLERHNT